MKKILFLYNNYEREHINIELISQELKRYKNKIYIVGITDENVIKKVIEICPDVIVTYPITTYIQIQYYKAIKTVCNCVIVTLTTEGMGDLENEEVLQLFVGPYDYSYRLIDYHIFWGKFFAKKIGREFLQKKRIISSKQIRVFGNPMYEMKKISKYYTGNKYVKIMKEDKNKKILVLTGFPTSEYNANDAFRAQDVVNINKTKEEIENDKIFRGYCEMYKQEKAYRDKYIAMLIDTAKKNPDITFYVKLHPQEILLNNKKKIRVKYLNDLRGIENIVLIEESIPIGTILPYNELVVHYGSTVDMESYMYGIPTLKLEERRIENIFLVSSSRITESIYYEDIDNKDAMQKYVKMIREEKLLFQRNLKTEKNLYDFMNYKKGEEYSPSREIADFLNLDLKKRRLKMTFKEIREVGKLLWGAFLMK